MAAIFELVVRAGLVVVTAIAAPPTILAYTWRRGETTVRSGGCSGGGMG
ncbi:hypothetical protein I41_39080 [Lacipirellula limnantheis]|uniref:Uncharacterized protein n=1 Tax=Lacipirellula limnantheis TaxID=2528024 RepID=A0A517U257_9BACT|nr:hypothetical protein I41_39080 [Lacipirellula limnantheis]